MRINPRKAKCHETLGSWTLTKFFLTLLKLKFDQNLLISLPCLAGHEEEKERKKTSTSTSILCLNLEISPMVLQNTP